VKAAEVGFLQRIHGVTLRDKACGCEILKTMNVEPLRVARSQLWWFGHAEWLRKD